MNVVIDQEWTDEGWAKILANVEYFKEKNARVGILSKGSELIQGANGLTIAEAAYINEFGAEGIPARSFLRGALRTPEAKKVALELGAAVMQLEFEQMEEALNIAGRGLADVMKERIRHGTAFRRNAPTTIRKKGFDHPLLETYSLVNAIEYDIAAVNSESKESKEDE